MTAKFMTEGNCESKRSGCRDFFKDRTDKAEADIQRLYDVNKTTVGKDDFDREVDCLRAKLNKKADKEDIVELKRLQMGILGAVIIAAIVNYLT